MSCCYDAYKRHASKAEDEALLRNEACSHLRIMRPGMVWEALPMSECLLQWRMLFRTILPRMGKITAACCSVSSTCLSDLANKNDHAVLSILRTSCCAARQAGLRPGPGKKIGGPSQQRRQFKDGCCQCSQQVLTVTAAGPKRTLSASSWRCSSPKLRSCLAIRRSSSHHPPASDHQRSGIAMNCQCMPPAWRLDTDAAHIQAASCAQIW